jgi:hypothetical protein
MDNFDSIKSLWDKGANADLPKPIVLGKTSQSAKHKLKRQLMIGTVSLLATGIYIIALALLFDFGFKSWLTFAGMGLVTVICWAQAAFLFNNYKRIASIEETSLPAEHLKQWQEYYLLRKRQNQWNGPVYFLLLNLAMGLYFIEIFSGRNIDYILILLAVYFGWMAYAYFILGKKVLKKENDRLQAIMDELKGLEGQFEKQD